MATIRRTDSRKSTGITKSKTKLDEFAVILHPVRLMIIRTLCTFPKMLSSEIRKMLVVSWGSYTTHLYVLMSLGMIEYRTEIINFGPKKTLVLTNKGFAFLKRFRGVMFEILDLHELETSDLHDV